MVEAAADAVVSPSSPSPGETLTMTAAAEVDDNNSTVNTSIRSGGKNEESPAATPQSAVASPLPQPVQGKSDWREFRALKLPNGVTAVLVHDRESKTTSAAACVSAGAASDPRSLPGLAHFCEHMSFLGSTKYPGENQYKQYLAQHGGRSNASTSLFTTIYKFEILAPHAETAIDMFAQFFVSPLFTESGTSREVHAVDSENSKNLTADARRRLQILKSLGDQAHYYTKFTTGNSRTLRTDTPDELRYVRRALLEFHSKHYRPDKLTVVVAGPQSLDELQEWVVPRFAPMKATSRHDVIDSKDAEFDKANDIRKLVDEAAKDAPPYGYEAFTASDKPPEFNSPFLPKLQEEQGEWPFLLTVDPVRAVRKLELMFPIQSCDAVPDQSPASILSHLLGHEGPNSPFAVLQNAGLLTSLAAGTRTSGPDFSLFHVDVSLTEDGEARWKEVVDVILQHARLIHAATLEAKQRRDVGSSSAVDGSSLHELHRIWGESCELDRIFFDTTSPGSVYDLAPSLCRRILMFGTQQCLSAGRRLGESESTLPLDALIDAAQRLVPSNCFIERCSKAAWEEMERNESNNVTGVERRTEPWYDIEYFVSEISQSDIDRWDRKDGAVPFFDASKELHLPRPNRYIPKTLELCPDLPDEAKQGPRIEKEIDPPELVVNNEYGRLWHRLDDRYALPKSVLTLLIRNAAVENVRQENGIWQYDTTAAVRSSLLAEMFSQALAQETYDADLAGLHWNLMLTSTGIKLVCSGFSDRLSDLALKLFEDFLDGSFIQESYFESTKERFVRNLRTYFESRRADSIAMYYRDLLLTAQSTGIDAVLDAAKAATLESTKSHHASLFGNDQASMECLYSGNVSKLQASSFFDSATMMFSEAFARPTSPITERGGVWIPGDRERRLTQGEDLEFHFTSQNKQEENGAVLATFQSPIVGFRGDGLSSEECLTNSASIRLISHILREPLFDELRTKQTLGYIVSSYYDRAIAVRAPEAAASGPLTVPVDFLVIVILSRKVSPPEVTSRLDDFLATFRESLLSMPESQIRHHATALSTKLLKPIQKLGTEASTHFSKITAFAPEVLASESDGRHESLEVPWNSVQALARKIDSLDRRDLVRTWDGLVLQRNRARIVSCVYGKTFPLDSKQVWKRKSWTNSMVVNSMSDIVALRETLPPFDNTHPQSRTLFTALPRYFGHQVSIKPTVVLARVAALAVIGASVAAGWSMFMTRSRRYPVKA